MIKLSPFLAEQRRDFIRERLERSGAVRSAALADELGVSVVTVRRDLVELHRLGFAEIVFGGARLRSGRVPPHDRRERAGVAVEAKRSIARAATGQLEPGDVIYLDSGTTCAAMVPWLAQVPRLTVVTNDLTTAIELVSVSADVSVVITAGNVDATTLSAVGELVADVLGRFVFDAAFLSASAWDARMGATTGDVIYAAVKRQVIDRAKRTFLLVDAGKFGVAEAHVIQSLSDFDGVITDTALDAGAAAAIRGGTARLIIASA